MEIFENRTCKLSVDPKNKILTEEWKGFTLTEEFTVVMDKVVECFKHYALEGILVDTQYLQIVSEEEIRYATSVMPVLISYGLKYMAFVIPQSSAAEITVDEFKANFEADMIHLFRDKKTALDWLINKITSNEAKE